MKIIIMFAFLGILGALAAAGMFMLKGGDKAKPGNMARALAWRVGLSVLLFLFLLLSYKMGWIQPTGIRVSR